MSDIYHIPFSYLEPILIGSLRASMGTYGLNQMLFSKLLCVSQSSEYASPDFSDLGIFRSPLISQFEASLRIDKSPGEQICKFFEGIISFEYNLCVITTRNSPTLARLTQVPQRKLERGYIVEPLSKPRVNVLSNEYHR